MLDQTHSYQRRVPWRALFDGIASIAMVIAATAIAWTAFTRPGPAAERANEPTVPLPVQPLVLDGAPVLGDPSASVALVAFSDFECPFCARFATEIQPELALKYFKTGSVKLVFRHLPLPIHVRAGPAAVAAECAGQQSAFWSFHDRVFAAPSRLNDSDFRRHAGDLSLDLVRFDACTHDEVMNKRVSADVDLATTLQVRGTPTFFAGRVLEDRRVQVSAVVAGARGVEEFERVLDPLIGER